MQFLRVSSRVRHRIDLHLAVHDLPQLHADEPRRDTACAADHSDAEGPPLSQVVLFQEHAKIGSEVASFVFRNSQSLILVDHARRDA